MLSFLLGSPRTLHNNKNQLPGCFLVLQHHFFLSLPRLSSEKGQSMTLLRKRTVDARGVRGIWIYAAQRTTNVGRDHPFVVCQVMSQKNMASWSTWQSLVHNSSGPWFEPRTFHNKKLSFLLGSNPGHYTTTKPASRLLPCTPAPFSFFLCLDPP